MSSSVVRYVTKIAPSPAVKELGSLINNDSFSQSPLLRTPICCIGRFVPLSTCCEQFQNSDIFVKFCMGKSRPFYYFFFRWEAGCWSCSVNASQRTLTNSAKINVVICFSFMSPCWTVSVFWRSLNYCREKWEVVWLEHFQIGPLCLCLLRRKKQMRDRARSMQTNKQRTSGKIAKPELGVVDLHYWSPSNLREIFDA